MVVVGNKDPLLVVTVAERRPAPAGGLPACSSPTILGAGATYVSLTDTPVARIRQFGDSVPIDLDEGGTQVGVELQPSPARLARRRQRL